MKNILVLAIGLFLFLGSCMDVHEKIYVNKAGEGTYEMEMDLAPIMDMMRMMGENGADSLHDSYEEIANEKSELEGMPGITAAKNTYDRATSRFKMNYSFADLAALNDAWNSSSALKGEMGEMLPSKGVKHFTGEKKKFKMNIHLTELRGSMEEISESEIDMIKMFMADSKYTLEMKFERPVKSFKGMNLSKGNDNHTVVFTMPFNDLFFEINSEKIPLSIQLK